MKNILIIVAGGSASGKTTVVSKLMKSLNYSDVNVICEDNYYKDQSHLSMEERKLTNYDHPNSIDDDLLYEDLKKLLNGESIKAPVYDFVTHNRKSDEVLNITPKKVTILEGILALYDERIRDLAEIKIFVESDDDIRFIRRLHRDITERGRTMEFVIKQYLDTVKPMYDAYISKTKKYADIIIPNDNYNDIALDILLAKIKEIIRG